MKGSVVSVGGGWGESWLRAWNYPRLLTDKLNKANKSTFCIFAFQVKSDVMMISLAGIS